MTLFMILLVTICFIAIFAYYKGNIADLLTHLKNNDGNGSHRRYSAGTHVVISGGSKGIGKCLAIKFAELGVHVTIIARDPEALRLAQAEIEKSRRREWQKINTVSLDLAKLHDLSENSDDKYDNQNPETINPSAQKRRQEIVDRILGDHDRCDILINCCGQAMAARFDDTAYGQFDYMMKVNYFSAVNLTKILLPLMKQRSLSTSNASRLASPNSHIVFVSSMAGLVSFFGYSAYSASKFALVALAEALHMELKPFDIDVTIAFPPDTNTPGFDQENKTKPDLTTKISELSGRIYEANDVAIQLIKDIEKRKFYSVVGQDNRLFMSLFNSVMPTQSVMTVLIECMYIGILKLVAYFMCRSWHKLVDNSRASEQIRAKAKIASKTKFVNH